MFASCIFCRAPLGRNEAIESFPIGRRLAFDAARGRLWVVCGRCSRWNLSPLEARFEAAEECERAYRGTRLRAATENVGLARLRDGTELVRVGRPLRPEFAAWRYGDQFRRRWRRAQVGAAVVGGVGLASSAAMYLGVLGVAGALAGALLWESAGVGVRIWHASREVARVRSDDGRWLAVRRVHLAGASVQVDAEHGWALAVHATRAGVDWEVGDAPWVGRITGDAARQALVRLLPAVNGAGAEPQVVDAAARRIDAAGDAESYVRQALASSARLAARRAGGALPLGEVMPSVRLALEMAVHEERERRALEGELAALEVAWRDAEEVARIADDLLVPDRVRRALDRLRGA